MKIQPIQSVQITPEHKELKLEKTQTENIKQYVKEAIKEEAYNPDKKELKNLLKVLNQMPYFKDKLKFGFSDDVGQLLVQISDKESGDVIRQYPSEDFIKRIMYYRDNVGMLFDEEA